MLRGQPMKLTTQRIFNFPDFFFVAILFSEPLRGYGLSRFAAFFVDLGGVTQMEERVEGRFDYVMRIRSANRLREHILNSRHFHYGAHGASGDDASAFGAGLQRTLPEAE